MAHNLTGHDHLTIFNVLLAWRQRPASACTQTLSLRERCQDPYHRHRCGRRRHRRQNLQRQLTALCGQPSAHYSMARMPTSAPEPRSRAAGEPVLQDAGHGRQLAFGDLLVMLVPLVVIVKDDGDDVVEAVFQRVGADEAQRHDQRSEQRVRQLEDVAELAGDKAPTDEQQQRRRDQCQEDGIEHDRLFLEQQRAAAEVGEGDGQPAGKERMNKPLGRDRPEPELGAGQTGEQPAPEGQNGKRFAVEGFTIGGYKGYVFLLKEGETSEDKNSFSALETDMFYSDGSDALTMQMLLQSGVNVAEAYQLIS